MKLLLFLFMSIAVSSCVVHEETKHSSSLIDNTTSKGSSTGVTYTETRTEIDQDLKEIYVIDGIYSLPSKLISADGSSQEFLCGLTMEKGSRITYDLISPDVLQLNLVDQVIELRRIHGRGQNVYGNWEYVDYGVSYSKRWSIYIEENDMIFMDFACSNQFE